MISSFGEVVHLRELVDGGDGHVGVLVDVLLADGAEEGARHPARGLLVGAEQLLDEGQAGHLADELKEMFTTVNYE